MSSGAANTITVEIAAAWAWDDDHGEWGMEYVEIPADIPPERMESAAIRLFIAAIDRCLRDRLVHVWVTAISPGTVDERGAREHAEVVAPSTRRTGAVAP